MKNAITKELFFSIIIPAHNEEKYIEATLQHLANLEYPKDLYEVIVVENGSTDKTLERASTHVHSRKVGETSVQVISTPECGVSKARNLGSIHASKDADWIFFLDADTFAEPGFLRSLATFLELHKAREYAIGTAELQPFPATPIMRALYSITNFFFKLRSTPFGGALFVRRSLLDKIFFDEDMQMGEDELFAKKAIEHGAFFFFSTKLIHTSTRRYLNGGWKKIPGWVGIWLFAMMIPRHAKFTASFKRSLKYKVIR